MKTITSTLVALALLLTAALPCPAQDASTFWRPLPLIQNGKLAPEWLIAGWGSMVVEGDAIRTVPSEKGLGVLVYTKEKFGNCQIRIVYRPADSRDNAGVHIRMDDGILKWAGKDSIDELR